MAIRNIVTSEDDILYKKTRKVEKFDAKLHTLLDDMKETMEAANGVGLAGPQVGILRQLCIIDVGDGVIELINPEIIESRGTQNDAEGCLSFPGEYGMVERPNYVMFKAQDRNGNWYEMEGEELFARAVFHETDHLSGVVFTTKVSEMLSAEDLQAMQEQDEEE